MIGKTDQSAQQTAAADAQARLQELETEIGTLPSRIKEKERAARSAGDFETVDKILAAKEKLEKRLRALPYLIPQARIAVLKAKAETVAAGLERTRLGVPAAIVERNEAQAHLEQAQKRFKDAESNLKRLTNAESGASSTYQILLQDAENIAAGRPTTRYFKATN